MQTPGANSKADVESHHECCETPRGCGNERPGGRAGIHENTHTAGSLNVGADIAADSGLGSSAGGVAYSERCHLAKADRGDELHDIAGDPRRDIVLPDRQGGSGLKWSSAEHGTDNPQEDGEMQGYWDQQHQRMLSIMCAKSDSPGAEMRKTDEIVKYSRAVHEQKRLKEHERKRKEEVAKVVAEVAAMDAARWPKQARDSCAPPEVTREECSGSSYGIHDERQQLWLGSDDETTTASIPRQPGGSAVVETAKTGEECFSELANDTSHEETVNGEEAQSQGEPSIKVLQDRPGTGTAKTSHPTTSSLRQPGGCAAAEGRIVDRTHSNKAAGDIAHHTMRRRNVGQSRDMLAAGKMQVEPRCDEATITLMSNGSPRSQSGSGSCDPHYVDSTTNSEDAWSVSIEDRATEVEGIICQVCMERDVYIDIYNEHRYLVVCERPGGCGRRAHPFRCAILTSEEGAHSWRCRICRPIPILLSRVAAEEQSAEDIEDAAIELLEDLEEQDRRMHRGPSAVRLWMQRGQGSRMQRTTNRSSGESKEEVASPEPSTAGPAEERADTKQSYAENISHRRNAVSRVVVREHPHEDTPNEGMWVDRQSSSGGKSAKRQVAREEADPLTPRDLSGKRHCTSSQAMDESLKLMTTVTTKHMTTTITTIARGSTDDEQGRNMWGERCNAGWLQAMQEHAQVVENQVAARYEEQNESAPYTSHPDSESGSGRGQAALEEGDPRGLEQRSLVPKGAKIKAPAEQQTTESGGVEWRRSSPRSPSDSWLSNCQCSRTVRHYMVLQERGDFPGRWKQGWCHHCGKPAPWMGI